MTNKEVEKTKKSNTPLIIVVTIIHLLLCYFLVNYHKAQITINKAQNEHYVTEMTKLEEKMKKETTKSPSIKKNVIKINPSSRLKPDIQEIEKQIENYKNEISELDKSIEKDILNKLESLIPEKPKKTKKPTLDDLIDIKEENKSEIGPTKSSEDNENIKETMILREKMVNQYEYFLKNNKKYEKIITDFLKKHDELEWGGLAKRRDIQWDVVKRIGEIERELKKLISEIETFHNQVQVKESNLESASSESELNEVSFATVEDINNKVNQEISNLNNMSTKVSSIQLLLNKSSDTNFYNLRDYNSLVEHFNKKFTFKKLLSTHDMYTKENMDERLVGKKNLLFYFDFYSKRRIGFFLTIPYPKRTILAKSYKDPNSFIAYFNVKEFYPANKDAREHFRTDADLMFLIGNTRNNDGIWFKKPSIEDLKNSERINVNFGKFSSEFDCTNGQLFSNPVTDSIFSFEVYELEFDS